MCGVSSLSDGAGDFNDLRRALQEQIGEDSFDLAVVLGSGWNHLIDCGQNIIDYDYRDWPCFPRQLIAGHAGRIMVNSVRGRRILLFAGRFHCYQGLSAFAASLPVRIAAELGCPRILLTCAAGGINPTYRPGDLVWVADHINLLGDNPLRGLSGETFVDLADLYAPTPPGKLSFFAEQAGIALHTGILAALPGPSYETPAEIRMLQRMGVDLVSMSVVHEAIMAAFLKLEVIAWSLIANPAAGLGEQPLRHQDVLACAESSRDQSRRLFEEFVELPCGTGKAP